MKKFLINILSPIIVPVLVGLIIYTDVYAGSILGITQGGTGLSNIPQGTILYGSSTDQRLNSLNIGTSGKVLTSDGSIPNWASSSVAWGLITGTLSSQTDLQNALDTKLSTTTAASTYFKLDQTTSQNVINGVPLFGGLGFSTTTPVVGTNTGNTYWDTANHTLSTVLENGVILQHGQELHIYGKNTSGSIIHNGDAVSIVTNLGSFTAFGLTDATNATSSESFVGLATQDIAINAFGFVTKSGVVRDINTSMFTEGQIVYVDYTIPGHVTSTPPAVPNYIIKIGNVEYTHTNHGRINVQTHVTPKLQDLSDVDGISLAADGQIPSWHNTGKYFDFDKNINNYVPYTGAINNLNLGTFDILAATSSLTKLIVSGTSTFPGGIWQGAGNVGIGTTAPTSQLHIGLNTVGIGTVSVAAGGTAVTGVGTKFLNQTHQGGFTITIGGETRTITGPSSDTALAVSAPFTNAYNNSPYTINGTSKVVIDGNSYGRFSYSSVLTEINSNYNGAYGLRTNSVVKGNGFYLYNSSGGFYTAGGIPMFYATAANQFGIGTTNPAGFLHVEGTGNIILNAGNVGIGITNPSEKLNVGGNILATGTILGFNLSGTNTGDNSINSQYSGLATSKQDTLVSGTNIKTINSNSLLGSGDLVISAGGGISSSTPFTSGYIPFATSTLFLTDSPISVSGNNIGIGTTTANKLSVNGRGYFSDGLNVGYNNNNSGVNAVTLGAGNTATGDQSVAIGYETTASGNLSFALGYGTRAVGAESMAFGDHGYASGDNSIAFGEYSTSTADNTVTFGFQTKALVNNSIAMGFGSQALNVFTLAIGDNTIASGTDAFSSGYHTIASGSHSASFGDATLASGLVSFASGFNTNAGSLYSSAFGQWNVGGGSSTAWVETDSLFEIGNGWDISNKRNAFAVLKNGNASVQGIFTASNLLGTWQGYNPVDFLASSTAFIANNSGNWAGTITNGVYTNAANSFSLINPLTTISESWIGPASTTGIYFKANNVGIGNINPAYKLDIIGDLRVATNGIGELFSTFKGANADGYNIWLGNSGQSSLGTTTATYKGSYNTSIGHDSLYSITTGYNNIGLGFGAGRYITGGATANQTSNNSVYLGHNTKASVDGNANEIVIGSDATGNGSNSITLGSTTILTTILRGAVGVGITNPSALINIQQSAASENLFLIKSQYNDTLFSIDQYGNGSIRSSGDSFGASFGVGTYYAANKGIVVRGYASQTSNLQEWQNSTGQVLSAVTDIGYHVFWNGTNYTCLHFASNSITPIYATSTSATCD